MSGSRSTVGQLLLIPTQAPPAIPTPKPAVRRAAWSGTAGSFDGRFRAVTQVQPGYYSARGPSTRIDIAAPTGTPSSRRIGGTVIFAGWKYSGSPGYGGGHRVWINSGGKLWTTYNHLSAEFVHVGQVVPAGQRIGNVGMTGNATGPHLHFEVWVCYPWSGGTTACAGTRSTTSETARPARPSPRPLRPGAPIRGGSYAAASEPHARIDHVP